MNIVLIQKYLPGRGRTVGADAVATEHAPAGRVPGDRRHCGPVRAAEPQEPRPGHHRVPPAGERAKE